MEFYKSGQATIQLKEKSSAPGPLGLLGFGLTTFLLNMHNAGVYPMNAMIIAMGVCYGGAAQIIAGLLEWKRGNLFASIAFLSYGFFWWSLCMILVLPKLGWAAAADHTSMGCYLFIWGCFSFCMLVGTFVKRLPIMLSWVFFTVVLLFALLAARHWMDSEEMEKIAGVEGVICGLSAIYVAFGEILNELSGRTILWIGVRPPLK
ncbi:hypothetical protein FGO68_gene5156 [Halteria grandinella]|uniref:GPR1/FUN34/yaaH family protein n=1 Tax=Halteria grandinella TaxID=5974 RepID=A0A8J8ND90_HALGN|nr:hypothetical protein FGO68_gene5156 [Halteria grandinella]